MNNIKHKKVLAVYEDYVAKNAEYLNTNKVNRSYIFGAIMPIQEVSETLIPTYATGGLLYEALDGFVKSGILNDSINGSFDTTSITYVNKYFKVLEKTFHPKLEEFFGSIDNKVITKCSTLEESDFFWIVHNQSVDAATFDKDTDTVIISSGVVVPLSFIDGLVHSPYYKFTAKEE
jgi:hypothetical protein